MKFLDTASLDVVSFIDQPLSDYAILSYTWTQPSDELTHHDIDQLSSAGATGEDWPGRHKAAYRRVVQACQQARERNIRYLWVDSVCVDQSSSADLVESVTASFRIVWSAALCIAHLPDLSPTTNDGIPLQDLEKALSGCRWFTRSWTLQELVAARRVEFFDRDWNVRGVKAPTTPHHWLEMLSRVSGVEAPVLADRDTLFDVSLGRRLSWAASRQTSIAEDAAYALMGICGVGGRLTPRYGEGRRRAFLRLQEKILKMTRDLSILAWKRQPGDDDGDEGNDQQQQRSPPPFSGILADSAADFRHFASHPAWDAPFSSDCELTFSNRGLCVRGLLSVSSRRLGVERAVVLVLNTSWRSRADSVHVGISLRQVEPGLFVRSNPREIVCFRLRKGDITLGRICLRCDIDDREVRRMCAEQEESRVSAWMDEVSEHTDMSLIQPTVLQGQMPAQQESTTVDTTVESTQHNNPGPARRGRQLSKRDADEMLGSDSHQSDSSGSEDDVLLFDSLPERPERLEDDHHFQPVLPQLVALGLAVWNDEKAATAIRASKKLGLPSTKCTTSRLAIGPIAIPFRPHKRARRGDKMQDDWSGDDSAGSYAAETEHDEPDMFVVRSRHQTPPDLLACPFYRLDPVRHHSCMWELELPNTRTIKQHVIVDHRLPEHCPVCHIVFDSAADRDQHIVARSCSEREAPVGLLVGVSEDQVEKLSQRENRLEWKRKGKSRGGGEAKGETRGKAVTLTEEEKWFWIWEILFPGVLRPDSAYLSAPQEREAVALRRFWAKDGPLLVAGILEERELLQWEDPREEAALAALHASVLKGMMEESGLAFQVSSGGNAGAG